MKQQEDLGDSHMHLDNGVSISNGVLGHVDAMTLDRTHT